MMPSTLRNKLLLLLLFAVLSIIFCSPILYHLDYWGILDWDITLLRPGVARETVLTYGQFPLWSPYINGGIPHLAFPESDTLSPAFIVELIFGVIRGAKVNIVIHLIIGLMGAYALARQYRMRHLAALTVAVIFMFNSMYAVTMTVGMAWCNPMAYMPWAFLFYLKTMGDHRYILATVVILALMWLGGGVYPFTITLLLLGTHGLFSVLTGKTSLKKTVIALGVIYGLTFLLGAVKFLPAIELTRQYRRISEIYSGFSLESLLYGLLARNQTMNANADMQAGTGILRGFSHGIDEVGMYVGIIPIILCLFGIISNAKKNLALLLCMLTFLWLSSGLRSEPFSLWALLHRLPPYSLMRTTERFRFVFILGLALFAGFGLEYLGDLLKNKWRNAKLAGLAIGLLTILIVVDLFFVNSPIFRDAFPIPPMKVPERQEFRQIGGWPGYDESGTETQNSNKLHLTLGAAYPALLANIGTIMSYESMPVPQFAIPFTAPEYRGEVYLINSDGNSTYRYWSPNRLIVKLDNPGHAMLVINQNYYSGWHITGGAEPVSYQGLLAVSVTPEVKEVEFFYRPFSFVVGALVSIITLIGMLSWLICEGLRKRRPLVLEG